jgi:L-iditol 2-dehydrogenase
MKALVKTRKGEGFIEIQEVPMPDYSANEVLIEVKAAGICGTDIHIYHDEYPYWPPVTMGHEFSGKVIEMGKNVKQWKKGDRVVGEPHTKACGICYLCRTGNIYICPHKRSIGWGIDGAFANYLKMPSHLLHKIPEGLSYEEAALTEPTAVVVNSVLLTAKVEPGDIVVVEGSGPIGLLSAMAARAAGAGKVIITGIDRDEKVRLKTARLLGFEEVVNVDKEDIVEKVLHLTQGRGADLVVEASGAEDSINKSIQITRRLGRIVILGITRKKQIRVNWNDAIFKGLNVKFSFSTTYPSWGRALSLIAKGFIKVSPLITHKVNLEEWEKTFSDLKEGKGIKGLFVF